MPTRHLLYLSYGGQPMQIAETRYGILSATRAVRGDDDTGLLLYTDHPEQFNDLPVEIRRISDQELADWAGAEGYQHRRKLAVLADALASSSQPTAFIDSDTWFRKPATKLFARIGPGRSVLHVREGALSGARGDIEKRLAAHLERHPLGPGPDVDMWNSGVIGVHPDDAHRVTDAIALLDRIWSSFRELITVEQLAISHALTEGTQVRPAFDVVYHYWHGNVRRPFHRELPRLLEQSAGLPLPERADVLHIHRPRLHGAALVKYWAKEAYRTTGRRTPTAVRSNAT